MNRLQLLMTIWLGFMLVGCILSVLSSKHMSGRVDKNSEITGGDIIHYSPAIAIQATLAQLVVILVSQLRHGGGIRPETIAIIIMTIIGLITIIIAIRAAWSSYVKYTTAAFDESWGAPLWTFMVSMMIAIDLAVFTSLPIILTIVLYLIPTISMVVVGTWGMMNKSKLNEEVEK